ncbi:MAG: hypothetical protein ABIP13_10820, partial [Tepidiformaceae bacterium]
RRTRAVMGLMEIAAIALVAAGGFTIAAGMVCGVILLYALTNWLPALSLTSTSVHTPAVWWLVATAALVWLSGAAARGR